MQTMKPVVPDKEGQYVCIPVRYDLAVAGFPEGKEELWIVDVRKVSMCNGMLGYTCPADNGDGYNVCMVEGCGHRFFGPIGDAK